jgi:uncharacterized protein YndB with AHSA1/START domain
MPYLFGLVASFGLFTLYVATRPAAFRIARTRTIPARPEAIFALINDFHGWAQWSPWEKVDPSMTRTYEGPAAGEGATYRWSGNGKAGAGSMVITASVPSSRVEIALAFLKPFPANNTALFTLEPDGDNTRVTWAMEGQNAFPAKAFGVFVNMDEMLGKDFNAGLEALAAAAVATA